MIMELKIVYPIENIINMDNRSGMDNYDLVNVKYVMVSRV